jgi:undecaprenol kinase
MNHFLKQLNSFACASRGIVITIAKERNMRIHALFAISAILISVLLNLSIQDFIIILILIASVFSAEMLNTSIEKICDILRDKYKLPYNGSRDIRDIAAGAVWAQAITAGIIGIIIFSKYLN